MYEVNVEFGGKAFDNATLAFANLTNSLDQVFDGASVPLSRELRATLQLVANKMRQLHGTPYSGGPSGPNLRRRSGNMLRDIQKSIQVEGASSVASLVGRISGPRIHEEGGTIRAKSAKYLTIPLPAALDGRGVPLQRRARDWQNTFVARSKRGNLLIFRKLGRREITPLYVLKPSVTIPARLGMQRVIQKDALPFFERKAFDVIVRELEKVI